MIIVLTGQDVTQKEFFMKSTRKNFGIIPLVAVIIFSMATCDNGTTDGGGGSNGSSGGVITITGIPAEHNGKFALFTEFADRNRMVGAINFNLGSMTATLPEISGGSVSIPMWGLIGTSDLVGYSGNDTGNGRLQIFASEDDISVPPLAFFDLGWFTFSNGNAQVNLNDPIVKGGTLTITGIPSEYNNKFAYWSVDHDGGGYLMGLESGDFETMTGTLSRIANGRASMPLWVYSDTGLVRYTGNHTIPQNSDSFQVRETNDAGGEALVRFGLGELNFSEGRTTVPIGDIKVP